MMLWRVPFQRWPAALHVLIASLICVSACVALGWWLRLANDRLAALHQDHVNLSGRLELAQREMRPIRSANFAEVLPTLPQSNDVVRDIGRFAASNGIQFSTLSIEPRSASNTELRQVQFNLIFVADYKSTKTLLSDLLARYSSLGVQSLSMRIQPNDPTRQDVRLSLLLFVRD